MRLDPERVRANAARAATIDLLDRITVYRAGMEPEALALIEAELASRGVDSAAIRRHAESRSEALMSAEGCAEKCSLCHAPALVRRWGWFKLWGRLPVLPWHFRYCGDHLPPLR